MDPPDINKKSLDIYFLLTNSRSVFTFIGIDENEEKEEKPGFSALEKSKIKILQA